MKSTKIHGHSNENLDFHVSGLSSGVSDSLKNVDEWNKVTNILRLAIPKWKAEANQDGFQYRFPFNF